MSMYNTFRRKQAAEQNCLTQAEAAFITEGSSAVVIYSLRLRATKNAGLIITDRDGPDSNLVYTLKERVTEQELLKGDYYTWNDNLYFVYEDVALVHKAPYKKQKSYQCNVGFKYNNQCYYGYYVASLTKYVDTTLQMKLNITDNDKPILILPQFDWIKVGVKIIIEGKPYKIIDYDYITNKGIAYCSLDRDFVDKYADITPGDDSSYDDSGSEPVGELTLIAGIIQNISTCFGYLVANQQIDIISRLYDIVQIVVPFGVTTINIATKNISGQIINTEYKVVMD